MKLKLPRKRKKAIKKYILSGHSTSFIKYAKLTTEKIRIKYLTPDGCRCSVDYMRSKTNRIINIKKMIKREDFIKAGFIEDNDPLFPFYKNLVTEEEIKNGGLQEDEIPRLLFGDTGVNEDFCIYTGEHFVWFSAESPKDAIEFAGRITAIEPV